MNKYIQIIIRIEYILLKNKMKKKTQNYSQIKKRNEINKKIYQKKFMIE